ncbi:MAG: protein-L-isoaspartate O-methyltransferase [Nanoarchaeota archaeon]
MNKRELIESLEQRGFSKEILKAFYSVKREDFVLESMREHSYDDTALPIGSGQTISQPSTIAVMLSLLDLKSGQKVLEVGSGSGYVLALLSEIIGNKGDVFGLEIIKKLEEKSKENISDYDNIHVFNRSGNLGLEEDVVFDRILISAACREIPEKIIPHLKNNGILVAPMGGNLGQSITSFKKIKNKLVKTKEIPGFVFVPFVEKNLKNKID